MRLPNTYACAVVASALLTGAAAPVITPPRIVPVPPPSLSRVQILPPLVNHPSTLASPDMIHMPKTYLVTGLHNVAGQTVFDGYTPGPVQILTLPVSAPREYRVVTQRR